MNKKEIIRNIGSATIPVCIFLFAVIWVFSHNIIAAAIIPTLYFIASLRSNTGKYRDDKKRAAAGVTKLAFNAREVYELIAPNDSVAPSLCFEIDRDKYLLLNGQWIFDDDIYDDSAKKFRNSECNIFNGYEAPFSFPAKKFEIWLSNVDGKPVRINILGNYLEPEQVRWQTPEKYVTAQFAIIGKNELKT